jgi:hypothetical protein
MNLKQYTIKPKNGLSTIILEIGNTRVSKAFHISPPPFSAGKMESAYLLIYLLTAVG